MKNLAVHRAIIETFVPPDNYALVEFDTWGVRCAAVFEDAESAHKWCRICIENGFNYPIGVYDSCGTVIFDEDTLHAIE